MYKFYNLNPCRKTLPDCVCRAISLATRIEYSCVEDLLIANGMCHDCDELVVDCYCNLLAKFNLSPSKAEGKKVSDLAKEYPDDTLLIRLQGHLTCVINGCCYDIWDCTEEIADIYWVL